MPPPPTPSAWLDQFFAAYYRHRPVNATFIGVHDYDHALPDFSEHGAGDTLAGMEHLLDTATAFDQGADDMAALDGRLATGFLKIQRWEFQSAHFHRGNPSVYTGEAIFGVMALFLSDFALLADRVDAATARLAAVPALLAQGRANVRTAPAAWTDRAHRACRGALAFLTEGIGWLVAHYHLDAPAFAAAAQQAAAAFEAHRDHLATTLRHRPSDHYACGAEALALYLREGHCLDLSADDIVRYARAELERAQAYLAEHAADFGADTPAAALAELEGIHPTDAHYVRRYQVLWDAVRAAAEAHDLVTWPDLPIRYLPQPPWARRAAPDLYFLPYRSPAAFNRPPVHHYLITPIDDTHTPAERRRRLRATNESVIKLNHVIHHGSIGHHVQNAHAFQSPSRIGRIAAVDCARRIALFCGGTMAEGWACYATDLMAEVGLLTPLERYAEQRSRTRMCARAIVDIRLHQGRMTLDEAAAFYQQHAGMEARPAMREAVKNSMFPGAAVMYMAGRDTLHALRREEARRQGNRFSLRAFHDAVLAYGSIPVSLIRTHLPAHSDA